MSKLWDPVEKLTTNIIKVDRQKMADKQNSEPLFMPLNRVTQSLQVVGRRFASLQYIQGKGGFYTVHNFSLWCNVTVQLPVLEQIVGNAARCKKVRKLKSAEVVKFSPHRQQWNC